MSTQLAITGDDWTSNRDRKAHERTEVARKKAALVCAKKLEAAADALNDFLKACHECNDAGRDRGADDSRRILQASMREYAGHLDSVFNK